MRDLSEEEIQNLEHFASQLFSDDQLAILLEIPEDEFRLAMKTKQKPVFNTVAAARLKTESSIRESIIEMAKRGSTPAQNMAEEMLKQLRKDNA